MSEEDKELEQLKKKRLAEMQKNISFKQKQEDVVSSQKNQQSPRELLVKQLGHRGLEVLQNAEYQFPKETKIVVQKLAELIAADEINEVIDGGKLLALFQAIGLNVRMQTKINIDEDGKFVSLSEKLKTSHSFHDDSNSEPNDST